MKIIVAEEFACTCGEKAVETLEGGERVEVEIC